MTLTPAPRAEIATTGLGAPSPDRPRPALLVVGHGTKSAAGAQEFRDLVALVADRAPWLETAGGFLELASPPIADAAVGLAAGMGPGGRTVAVVPLVLAAAGHAKGDIPAALERERQRHPGLDFTYGRALGPHPALLEILTDRLDAVLDPADRAETAVLVVGRGSSDPDANAEIVKVARLFDEGRGIGTVETAFISLTHPSVPQGLERCRRLGFSRVVVLPYFLFGGVLPDRIVRQAREWEAEHPDVEVRAAGLLGVDPRLADLVLERHAEAVRGDVRMNCDTCLYRVKMVGFEHRVGQPQTPHDHPDDPTHSHGHGDHHGHGHGHAHGHAHG